MKRNSLTQTDRQLAEMLLADLREARKRGIAPITDAYVKGEVVYSEGITHLVEPDSETSKEYKVLMEMGELRQQQFVN